MLFSNILSRKNKRIIKVIFFSGIIIKLIHIIKVNSIQYYTVLLKYTYNIIKYSIQYY